jgi:hypothetical protein
MVVPSVAVVTEPCCRRRLTVPLVVGSQFRVVASPTVKEYPPEGILKGLAVLLAVATAARAETVRQIKERIV